MTDSVQRARRLYKKFHGDANTRLDTVTLPDNDVALRIGECTHIAYRVDGENYIHRFKSRSRPVLAVSDDGLQLYLIGGSYKFTDRGIEDT